MAGSVATLPSISVEVSRAARWSPRHWRAAADTAQQSNMPWATLRS